MSARTDIDRLIEDWLTAGAERAPHDRVQAALVEVASTRQRRPVSMPRFSAGALTTMRPATVIALAVAFAALLGLGVAVRVGVIRLPTPNVVPTPNTVTYELPAAGFAITLPDEWEMTSGGDALEFVAERNEMRLFIAAGDEDGEIRICDAPAGRWEDCGRTRVNGIGGLVAKATPLIQGVRKDRSTLDGELARVIRITTGESGGRGGQLIVYVLTEHDGRPFVARLWAGEGPVEPVDDLLNGFRFTEAHAPTTYDITIPDGWVEDDTTLAGIRSYSIVEDGRSWPALTIAVENDQGLLDLCVIRCASLEGIDTIDDVRDALRDERVLAEPIDTPYGPYTPKVTWFLERDETTLAGEPARVERPVDMGWEAIPGQYEHVYAVHDGRAVVLSFDYRSIRTGRISDEDLEAILASFAFTD